MGDCAYRFWKEALYSGVRTLCYLIDTVWGDGQDVVYQLNFYDGGGKVYPTDFFPTEWRNDQRCFKRSASREGHPVNVRKIVRLCFRIFLNEFFLHDRDAVMVVRGSTSDMEERAGLRSRKTGIYYRILKRDIEENGLEIIDKMEEDVFFIGSGFDESRTGMILQSYEEFRRRP